MIECVVNVSEGRDRRLIDQIAAAAGPDLLDVHSDPDHNRSVLTLIGENAPRSVAEAAVDLLVIGSHSGAHPRIGVIDVVPFVPLAGSTMPDAEAARDAFGTWAAATLDLPGFSYGSHRSLPDIRRSAFGDLAPTWGRATPHPTAGAVAVGARPLLVAYNVWVTGIDLAGARSAAAAIRSPTLRALGLAVGDRLQVSMNLVEPDVTGPAEATDEVAAEVAWRGGTVSGCELVGLVPRSVLEAIDLERWEELDLSPARTIEQALNMPEGYV